MGIFGSDIVDRLLANNDYEGLIKLLEHKNYRKRFRALWALGKIAPDAYKNVLFKALKDENKYVRREAINTFINIFREEKDLRIRTRIDLHRYLNSLMAYIITDKLPYMKKLVEDFLEFSEILLRDSDTWIRCSTVEALYIIGGKESHKPLYIALKDEDDYVRGKAAEAIRYAGWEPTNIEEKIILYVAKKEWDELIKIGRPARSFLISLLKEKNKYVRKAVKKVLNKIITSKEMNALLL